MLVELVLMMSSTESAKLQFLQWPPEAVKASQCYKHVQSVHTVSYSSGGTRWGSFGFSAISPVRQLHLLSHSSPHSPDLSISIMQIWRLPPKSLDLKTVLGDITIVVNVGDNKGL